MKALREWMSELDDDMAKDVRSKEPSTLLIFNHQYDAISGMILAMADVMEAAEQRTEFSSAPCIYCSYLDGVIYKMCDYHAALSVANKVIKEVTG